MATESEQIYETLKTEGWTILKARMQEQYDAENMVTGIKTQTELDFVRGRLSVFRMLIDLEEEVKEEIADL